IDRRDDRIVAIARVLRLDAGDIRDGDIDRRAGATGIVGIDDDRVLGRHRAEGARVSHRPHHAWAPALVHACMFLPAYFPGLSRQESCDFATDSWDFPSVESRGSLSTDHNDVASPPI